MNITHVSTQFPQKCDKKFQSVHIYYFFSWLTQDQKQTHTNLKYYDSSIIYLLQGKKYENK